MDFKAFVGDLTTTEIIIWLLVLFLAVVWWGFGPLLRNRQRRRDGKDNPDD